ncbi:hypothetical protein ABPG73_014197 [Tetrahymena malaccensis]
MNFRRIDLFSSKFNFNADESSIQKGTYLGSIYSLIVVCLVLSYIIYIFAQYANNQIEPVYRSQNIINNSTQEINLKQNIFAYKINYRFLDPKKYAGYVKIQINGIFSNSTSALQVPFQSQQCSDFNILDYQCINLKQQINENLQELIQEYNYILSQITISVIGCNVDLNSDNDENCPNQTDIDKFMNNIDIQFKLQVKQFNIYSKQMDSTYQTVTIFTSSDLYKTTSINLQNQQILLKQGLFFQNVSVINAPAYYQVDTQSLNRQFVIQNYGFSPYSYTSKNENQGIKQSNKETDEANKDGSVFIEQSNLKQKIKKNTLNNDKNYEESLPQSSLESHYKGPKLSYPINKQECQNSSNTLNISLQNQTQLNMLIDRQPQQQHMQQLIQHDQQKLNKQEQIVKPNQQQKKYIVNLKMSQNKIITSKLKKIIFDYLVCNKKKYLRSKGLEDWHQKKMIQQIDQDFNIAKFYEDLIFLKKAIMILLSQDQLATLQLIGCSQTFLNLNLDQLDAQSTIIMESIKTLNHYEQQLVITQSQNLKDFYAQSFLKRCSPNVNNQDLSEVDKRILESISKFYLN